MDEKLSKALNEFFPGNKTVRFDVIKSGNINDTYVVEIEKKCTAGTKRCECYTLQRINGYVFKEPDKIMSNISRVTEHIKNKIEQTGQSSDNRVITPVPTADGKTYFESENGDFWRVYPYIKNSVCYSEINDPRLMTMVGKAFGEFQNHLSDFPAESLHETIPDFHNTIKRYEKLYKTADKDPHGRLKEVENELAYLQSIENVAGKIDNLVKSGTIATRVTHNDTKSNNVLLDAVTNEPLAVIDLDTVMPGLAIFDFGDAVRFGANKSVEDEADLRCVGLDLDKYEAFTRGFIQPIRSSLTKIELDSMALGAITMTSELATRFLEDYIAGDLYFKTAYNKHNLVRARCQIALANDMLLKYDKMCNIIEKYM